MRVLLGITGGIAAYKSAEIIRSLTELGHEVRVLPTENALRFIGATTLEALSHNVVDAGLYTDVESVKHIELGQWADVVLVAPATASFLARTAAGIADDLLGNVMLATKARIIVAPAMHTEMWLNEATIENVRILHERGIEVIEPASGRLTGEDSGIGRLPDTETIVAALLASGGLSGKRVIVTAGGTREPIDPVRFIGNFSSGKQGIAIALAAADTGAEVTLIAANLDFATTRFDVIRVETAAELQVAVRNATTGADALVMSAAVSDYRVKTESATKLKKSTLGETTAIELVANPDILAEVDVPGLLKVGFAAETDGDLSALAKLKLKNKGCQLLVANDVSNGAVFGDDETSVVIVDDAGGETRLTGSKSDVAKVLIQKIVERLS
jgi:phosphopantothenoylcysteine decarboxylase/phosphopantothenate--cysteine ligase